MDKLFNGKGYIDGITIIDLKGEILFTAKFNNKLSSNQDEEYEVVGQNFLDVYENLSEETSSTYKAMTLGVPIYKEKQNLKSKGREEITITSLSIPIKSGNSIVGGIDLSVSEDNKNESIDSVDSDSVVDKVMKDTFKIDNLKYNSLDSLHKEDRNAKYTLDNIITVDNKMLDLKEYVKIAAKCNLPTLICGETGTGKELFAQAIHNCSDRKDKPFISQNCAAIPENLLDSILFGTSKGAFTGAIDNVGLFEMANKGTLFLDEINSMPIHLQSKLLRVIEENKIRRIGSQDSIKIDVRIIAAMNGEPFTEIESGKLRKDIYYRLNAINISIPALRDRIDDIPILINHFVVKYNNMFNKNIQYISNDILEELKEYKWPGNIRELENIMVYAMSIVDNDKQSLDYTDIKSKLEELVGKIKPCHDNNHTVTDFRDSVEEFERKIIESALKKTNYNVAKASRLLSLPRQTLQRKVQKYDLI
jgi:arginine utilization regulatory protein